MGFDAEEGLNGLGVSDLAPASVLKWKVHDKYSQYLSSLIGYSMFNKLKNIEKYQEIMFSLIALLFNYPGRHVVGFK